MKAKKLLEEAIGPAKPGTTQKIYPQSITLDNVDLYYVLKSSNVPRWGDESCIEIDNDLWNIILKFVGSGGYADLDLGEYLNKMYP